MNAAACDIVLIETVTNASKKIWAIAICEVKPIISKSIGM